MHIYRLGPGPLRLVAENLGRSWYTYSQLAFTGQGNRAWTLADRNLVRLKVRP